jgi:hypothetical protein
LGIPKKYCLAVQSIPIERASMHCQGIAYTNNFTGLTSAEARKLYNVSNKEEIICYKFDGNLVIPLCCKVMLVFDNTRLCICIY